MQLKKLFQKYMRVKDPHKAHAVLSASGSERWLGCPGSVKLSEGISPIDNEHSIRGTNTHTLIQFILENEKWVLLLRSKESLEFKQFIGYDPEMLTSALCAVAFVIDEQKRMTQETGRAPQLLIEQKVELEGVGFGTADIMLYQPFGVLHVADYKNGKYGVEPEENTQGLYYACAAADFFGWDVNEIWITIIQPNSPNKRGPIRTWKITPKRLEEARRMLRLGAKKTKEPNAPLVMNAKYCWFCVARVKCPEQMKVKEGNIMDRFHKDAWVDHNKQMMRKFKNFCDTF